MSTISKSLPTPPDNFSTQIATASVTTSTLSIELDDATNLPTEGVGQLMKKDADGNVIAGSVEFIHWTNKSGSTITLSDTGDRGITGSDSGAQAYVSDDYFEVWVSSYYNFRDAFDTEHNQDGTHSDITADSITLASGATPTEFSTDGTLAGNSDVAVPTEKAVKTYVDTEIAGVGGGALQDTDHSGGSSTSSSTYANITGADVSITLTQTSHILLIGVVQAYANPGAQTGANDYQVQLHDGTSAIGSPMGVSLDPGNVRTTVVVTHVVPSVSAGAHTYTLQHRSTDNALSCTAEAINMSAIAIPA